MSEQEKYTKQIHVWVSEDLYNDLKSILPEKGMLSIVVRRLLRGYLKQMKDGGREFYETK